MSLIKAQTLNLQRLAFTYYTNIMIISDPISMYVCKASLPTLWSQGFNIIYEGIMMHMTTCLLENECLTKPLMKSFCEKILRADPSFIENILQYLEYSTSHRSSTAGLIPYSANKLSYPSSSLYSSSSFFLTSLRESSMA